ncbi:hypothetical protein [Celeribacter persicus]|uniref:Uncharacterized protein n=1 Tax=Celeribacter persicus TaxID=1651082 RepID=A0A2T5HME9_9RHOB|nr:hypothetical protein [Celeribacter persicus]PTQ72750.1 hypothetical protein C8N42_106262 [Celeribacter persicus]
MNSQLDSKFSILEERRRADRHLGKLVNRLRLAGIVTAMLALVIFLSLRQSDHPQTDLATTFMIAIGALGFGIALAGEAFWRALRLVTSVDEREF